MIFMTGVLVGTAVCVAGGRIVGKVVDSTTGGWSSMAIVGATVGTDRLEVILAGVVEQPSRNKARHSHLDTLSRIATLAPLIRHNS